MIDFVTRSRMFLAAPVDLPPEINVNDKRPRAAIGYDTTSGARSIPPNAKRMIIVAQMLTGGTGIANTVYDLVAEGDAAVLFKDGSMADMMARSAFKAYPQVKISAVCVGDPGGGTVATLANTFATNAAMNGAYVLVFGGKQIVTQITKADTPTMIATNHVAAVNADASLPFTAANAAGVVTYTTKAKGIEQNQLKLRGFFSVVGIGTTATLATTYTAFAGGTLVSDLTTAYAAAMATRYHERAIGLSDSASGQAARDDANTKGDAEHSKGEVVTQGLVGAMSAATTLAAAINGPRNQVYALNGTGTPPWSMAAAVAAVKCSETRAAMPYNFLPVAGIEPPPIASRWMESELRTMLDNGVSPLVVVPGDIVCMYRSISTYFTNTQSAIDYSRLDIMDIQCFDRVREAIDDLINTKYQRVDLADDDPDGLLPSWVITPSKVKRALAGVMRQLETEGTVQQADALADQIDVEIDGTGTNLQISVPTDFVKSLQAVFGKIVRTVTPTATPGQ